MESIIIHANSKKDLSLIQQLAEKMGLKAQFLTLSEKEDIALANAIQENIPAKNLMGEEAVSYYKELNKAE